MKHEVIDQGESRFYWTQIPNIVFDIGLTPYELLLYANLKRIAGEKGKCYKSTRSLAKQCGISLTVVVRTKNLLAEPRPALGNKPLIKIAERKNPEGGKDYHEITITDIWGENALRYSQVPNIELVQVPRESEQVPYGGTNKFHGMEHKKNTTKKNKEEEQYTALKSDPAYSHVDVEHEFQKAQRWAKVNNRQVTPRFFVNWLNRIDKPFHPNGDGRTYVDDEWDKALTLEQVKARVEG